MEMLGGGGLKSQRPGLGCSAIGEEKEKVTSKRRLLATGLHIVTAQKTEARII
jgi:hypothetical protein